MQIFDSWSGVLDEENFDKFCIQPVNKMVKKIRSVYPDVPIIAFPKGAGFFYENYAEKTGVSALSLDWTYPLDLAVKLQEKAIIQGNLDPLCLCAGGEIMEKKIENILDKLKNGHFIFNLGHGIVPQTPIENVNKLIKMIRQQI